MRRLAIIVADDTHERFRTALVTAAAHVALGGAARFFFQGAAVSLLRSPIADPDAERQSAVGLPTLAQLFEETAGLGVHFTACQSSLALLGLSAGECDSRIEWGGMIGFMSAAEPGEHLIAI